MVIIIMHNILEPYTGKQPPKWTFLSLLYFMNFPYFYPVWSIVGLYHHGPKPQIKIWEFHVKQIQKFINSFQGRFSVIMLYLYFCVIKLWYLASKQICTKCFLTIVLSYHRYVAIISVSDRLHTLYSMYLFLSKLFTCMHYYIM